MNTLLNLVTTSPEATAFGLLILLGALAAYLGWFRPPQQSLQRELAILTETIENHSGNWETAKTHVRQRLKDAQGLAAVWLETEERVVKLSACDKSEHTMFGAPKDLWNAQSLLSRRINLGLADAVPNLLVGIGLFFTFAFLSWALVETTTALTNASSSKATEAAISQLLRIAGGKFLTSLAGLLASIVWTLAFKRSIKRVSIACDALLDALGKAAPPSGSERITLQHLATTEKSIEQASDANALAEELLNEAREQTGTFKRFETDLAVSLAGAITQAFTPQMQAMTERLVFAIEGLSDKLGTMNQEALKTMMDDFAAMLKQATATEMEQLQRSLRELAGTLNTAGESFGAGANSAATAIHDAGDQLVNRMQESSNNLAAGADSLEKVTASVRLSFQELAATVEQASSAGKHGIALVHQALEQAGLTSKELANTSNALTTTSDKFTGVGEVITAMVENVQELSREQRAVVLSVQEATPNALNTVERVTDLLGQVAGQTFATMEQAKNAMEFASGMLTKTVASISELEHSAQAIQKSFQGLETTVEQASNAGQKGVVFVNQALEKAHHTVEQLTTMSAGLLEATHGLSHAGGMIANVVDNVEELAREQRAVVLSVKEVAPNAMAAVDRVTEILDRAAAQTLSSMQQTKNAMESTANALGKTVNSITEGVSSYTTQVAELHRTMDSQLARVVGNFDKGVNDLTEVVEELTETLQSARRP